MNIAKQYLSRYASLSVEKMNLQYELKSLINDAAALPGIDYAKDKVQTSPSADGILNIILGIERQTNAISKALKYIMDEQRTIEQQINGMQNANYKRLLHLHYIQNMTLDQTAEVMGFNEVRHMHGYALDEFYRLYLKDHE